MYRKIDNEAILLSFYITLKVTVVSESSSFIATLWRNLLCIGNENSMLNHEFSSSQSTVNYLLFLRYTPFLKAT
jgi:hypothetical protein